MNLEVEQANEEAKMAQIEAGRDPRARKSVYVQADLRLISAVKKFDAKSEFMTYLRMIAHNTSYWANGQTVMLYYIDFESNWTGKWIFPKIMQTTVAI